MNRWVFLGFAVIWCLSAVNAQDFFDPGRIAEIRLYFEQPDWEKTLAALKENEEEDRIEANLVVDGLEFNGVGVRYKGNSSYHNVSRKGEKKLPFNIKIDHTDKSAALPGGYSKLKLSNGFRDPSFMREVLAYEIAREYMPASRANLAQVFVNDTLMGLYTSVQSVDDPLLGEHFDEHKGPFFKCDPVWGFKTPADCPMGDKASLQYLGEDSACYAGLYEMKSEEGWTDLIRLARILNEEPERIEEVLNVDQALWMLAFDNLIVNLDSYLGAFCHNYYLYRDQEKLFHPIIWDMNLAFGGFTILEGNTILSTTDLAELSMFIHYKNQNPKRPLITQLLSNDLFRKVYLHHLYTILEDHFVSGKFKERVMELQALASPLVEKDTNRFYSVEAFRANLEQTVDADGTPIIGLLQLMDAREAYLLSHPLANKEKPSLSEVRHRHNIEKVTITAQASGADQLWLCYSEPSSLVYHRIRMEDNGLNGDEAAGDQIWGAQINYRPGLQYYVIAEGPYHVAIVPKQAGFKAHVVD